MKAETPRGGCQCVMRTLRMPVPASIADRPAPGSCFLRGDYLTGAAPYRVGGSGVEPPSCEFKAIMDMLNPNRLIAAR